MTDNPFEIRPYKTIFGTWLFTDKPREIRREALVSGTDLILDMWSKQVARGRLGLRLLFSDEPFPGWQHYASHAGKQTFTWEDEGDEGFHLYGRRDTTTPVQHTAECGDLYMWEETGDVGYLCPRLLHYFTDAPAQLYVAVQSLGLLAQVVNRLRA